MCASADGPRRPGPAGRRAGGSLRSQALRLGAANACVTAMRFLAPMAMVRLLDQEAFGLYRIFWLFGLSAVMIAPLGFPRSLLYLLPRSDAGQRRYYVYQTLLLTGLMALATALSTVPGSPLVKAGLRTGDQAVLLPVFLFCWVLTRILDFLPSAENRTGVQSVIIVTAEFLRQATVLGTALATRSLLATLYALTAFAVFKALLLLAYVLLRFGPPSRAFSWAQIREQTLFSVPMGLTYMLNNLRKNAEQWLAALLFSAQDYAVFVIGAMNIPVLAMLRQTLTHVTLPRMSAAHQAGEHELVFHYARSANLATTLACFPIAVYLMVFAHPVVELAFTGRYAAAAPVLQVYLLITLRQTTDMNNIMMLYNQKMFLFVTNIVLLGASVLTSYLCSLRLGMVGIAMGSAIVVYLQAVAVHWRISRTVGIPVARLQDWRGILCALGAALGAALAGLALADVLGYAAPLPRLAVSLPVMLVLYPALVAACGYGWTFKALLGRRAWRGPDAR